MLEDTGVKEICSAAQTLRELSTDYEARCQAISREKDIRDYAEYLWEAQNEGISIGRNQGIDIGISQGIDIGRDRVREELIVKMRSKGYSEEQISELLD